MSTAAVQHAEFCLPRPGEDAPRTERYVLDRPGPDGRTVTSRVLVTRCLECGEADYTEA